MWPSSSRQINYGLPSDMGMVGLRDVYVVAPAASFHHQHDPTITDPHSVGVGVGVLPLLTVDDATNRGGGIQFWQNQQIQHHHQQQHYLKKPLIMDQPGSSNLIQNVQTSSSSTTCQDCGNQAKKDCSHRRCRTCCKSRGFDCSTHVKSTWVPAARRRERQLMGTGTATGSSVSTSGVKKARLIASQTTTTSHTSTSNTTPPRSFDTSSSHQDAGFKDGLPGEVRAPAVFKCVRVSAMDEGEDEYAYQAVVKIQGHIFKGFLYDQGVTTKDVFPNISELHLGGGECGRRNGASTSSPIIDPANVYGGTADVLLGGGGCGGSGYGNPIN